MKMIMNLERVGSISGDKNEEPPVPGEEDPVVFSSSNDFFFDVSKDINEGGYSSGLESLESGEIESIYSGVDLPTSRRSEKMESEGNNVYDVQVNIQSNTEDALISYPNRRYYQHFDPLDKNSTEYSHMTVVSYPQPKRAGYGESGGKPPDIVESWLDSKHESWKEENKNKMFVYKNRPRTHTAQISNSTVWDSGKRVQRRRSRSKSLIRRRSRSRSPRGSYMSRGRGTYSNFQVYSRDGGRQRNERHHKRRSPRPSSPIQGKRNSREETRSSSTGEPIMMMHIRCPHCKYVSNTYRDYHNHLDEESHQLTMKEVFTQLMTVLKDLRRKAKQEYHGSNNFCSLCQTYCGTQSTKEHSLSKIHKTISDFLKPKCKVCDSSSMSFMDHEEHICELKHIKRKCRLKGVEIVLKDQGEEEENELLREKNKDEFEKKIASWEREIVSEVDKYLEQLDKTQFNAEGSNSVNKQVSSVCPSAVPDKKNEVKARKDEEKKQTEETNIMSNEKGETSQNKSGSDSKLAQMTIWANKFKRMQQQKLYLEKQRQPDDLTQESDPDVVFVAEWDAVENKIPKLAKKEKEMVEEKESKQNKPSQESFSENSVTEKAPDKGGEEEKGSQRDPEEDRKAKVQPPTEKQRKMRFIRKLLSMDLKGSLLKKPNMKNFFNIGPAVLLKSENDIGTEYCELIDAYYCELCRMYVPHAMNMEKAVLRHCHSLDHAKRYMRHVKIQHRKSYLERVKTKQLM